MGVIETEHPGATIRRRKKGEAALSDSCCTPEFLTSRLPLVDVDPASNPRSHVRARWSYSLETKLDGLILPWRGSLFLNHPYSNPMPWMQKLNKELSIGRCTNAIVLAKLDCSTEWWKYLTAGIFKKEAGKLGMWRPDLWLFNDRIEFEVPPELLEIRRQKILALKAAGKKAPPLETSNNFCSCIIHHRFGSEPLKIDDIATLWRRN